MGGTIIPGIAALWERGAGRGREEGEKWERSGRIGSGEKKNREEEDDEGSVM